jgi:nucleotide-binding universal stress UspA family protein
LYQTDITVQVKEETAKQHKLQANRNLSVIEKATKDADVPCETFCEISDYPYETIIRVAEQKGCDLIMMASHGRKGVKGLLLGSETQKVLTHSKIPVLGYR